MIDLMTLSHVPDHRAAIADATEETTYGALRARAARLASLLVREGRAKRGDRDDLAEARVAVLVAPGIDWVVSLLAVWQAGGVAVPLAPQHPPAEWAYVLDDAEVELIVAEPAFEAELARVAGGRHIVSPRSMHDTTADSTVASVASRSTADGAAELPEREQRAPARRALMLYTSGTTGRPKGVVHTHGSLQAQVASLLAAWEWRATDRTLLFLPLHHVHGVVNVVCCALAAGAHLTMHPRFEASACWSVIESGRLTLLHAVPTIWSRLLASFDAEPERQRARQDALAAMRLLVSGSAALPVSLLERWHEISGHVLLERYGMTEIGMALSNPLHGVRVPGHVGQPLPGVEVRVVDAEGAVLPPGEAGELEVRGPGVMREYWRRAEETARAFHDGWFRTGDVAVLEETVGGPSYRLLGRQSVDIIKTGGYKVSALEIEEVLRTHASVLECAVVGVPDVEWGERVAAAVELAPGASLSIDELRGFLRERLAVYKVPSALVTPSALPRNAMGKVVKREVRALFVVGASLA